MSKVRRFAMAAIASLVFAIVGASPASATTRYAGEGCYVYASSPVEVSHPGAGVKSRGWASCSRVFDKITVGVELEKNNRRLSYTYKSRFDVKYVSNTTYVKGMPVSSSKYRTTVNAAGYEEGIFVWAAIGVMTGWVNL